MQAYQEEQISSRELILKIIHLKQLVSKQWRFLLIMMAIGTLISLYLDWVKYEATQYRAITIFNLEIGGNNAAGGDFAGLAGAFGVGNVARSADLLSGNNFNDLIQSRAVYERALMHEITIKGKKLLLINYYKDSSDIAKKEWGSSLFHKANSIFINYHFTKKEPEDFTRQENEIVADIVDKLQGQTQIQGLNKTSSLTSISAVTNNEMLSKVWIETLLKAVEEFYKDVKTKKTRDLLGIQTRRLDSLQRSLYSVDSRIAATTNQNQNVVDANGPMRQTQLTRNSGHLSAQYFAQMNVVENLRMTLIDTTPLFTILEPIRMPLAKTNWHVGNNTTIGCILGFILALVILIVRKTYQDIMNSVT